MEFTLALSINSEPSEAKLFSISCDLAEYEKGFYAQGEMAALHVVFQSSRSSPIQYIELNIEYDKRISDQRLTIRAQRANNVSLTPLSSVIDLFQVNETTEANPYFFFITAWDSYGDSDSSWIQINVKRSYPPIDQDMNKFVAHYFPPAWQIGAEALANVQVDLSDLQEQKVVFSTVVQNEQNSSISDLFFILAPIDIMTRTDAEIVGDQLIAHPSIGWDKVYSAYEQLENMSSLRVSTGQSGGAASEQKSFAVIPDNASYVNDATAKSLVALDKYLSTHYVFGFVVDVSPVQSVPSGKSSTVDMEIKDLNMVAGSAGLFPVDKYSVHFSVMMLFEETALEKIEIKLPKWAGESNITVKSIYKGEIQDTYDLSWINGELVYQPGISPILKYCYILEITGTIKRSNSTMLIIIASPFIASIFAIIVFHFTTRKKNWSHRKNAIILGTILATELFGVRSFIIDHEQAYQWTSVSLFETVLFLVGISFFALYFQTYIREKLKKVRDILKFSRNDVAKKASST